MRRQSVIALGIAIVLGLFAVYIANVFLTSTQNRADAADAGTARVAVAAVPVDYGVELTPEKIRFANFPVNSIPPGSFSNINQLMPEGKARIALMPMQINEPILASKVTGDGQNASISALLPDGKRAAAVRINDVSGVAGFIQPNDTVDVLITRQVGNNDRSQQVTDVLLQNIRVIAMDQDAKSADGKPSLAKTATLELDPIEAQKLALGQQVGQISLVLRKPGEEQNTATQTVSMTDLRYQLYGTSPRPQSATQPTRVARALAPRRTVRRTAPAARSAAPPRPTTSSVEVVRGTVGNSYEVGEYGS